MRRIGLALLAAAALGGTAQAGLFSKGIGSAMIYGPYTGGHNYSYNVAYSYGFAFSSADTWRRDPIAYPAGIYPYRPYDRPITHRAWPQRGVPPISVPGDDGLPVLVHPGGEVGETSAAVPGGVVHLQPVPTQTAAPATVEVRVPADAEVWFEKQKIDGSGAERAVSSPPLEPGRTYVYTIRAAWTENGRPVEQVRVVGVRAGETAKVNFLAQR